MDHRTHEPERQALHGMVTPPPPTHLARNPAAAAKASAWPLVVLALGNVLSAGFDQVYNLYSPAVYPTGDIIDTFVYRLGLQNGKYAIGTAVGLFKSVISCTLISLSLWVAYRFANYRVF